MLVCASGGAMQQTCSHVVITSTAYQLCTASITVSLSISVGLTFPILAAERYVVCFKVKQINSRSPELFILNWALLLSRGRDNQSLKKEQKKNKHDVTRLCVVQ